MMFAARATAGRQRRALGCALADHRERRWHRRADMLDGMVKIDGGKFFRGSDEPGFALWQPQHTSCRPTASTSTSHRGEVQDVRRRGGCSARTRARLPESEKTTPEQPTRTKEFAELCTSARTADQAGPGEAPRHCVPGEGDIFCKTRVAGCRPKRVEFAARGSDGRSFRGAIRTAPTPAHERLRQRVRDWEKARGVEPKSQTLRRRRHVPGTAPVGSFPIADPVRQLRHGRQRVGVDQRYYASYAKDAQTTRGRRHRRSPSHPWRRLHGGFELWSTPRFAFTS